MIKILKVRMFFISPKAKEDMTNLSKFCSSDQLVEQILWRLPPNSLMRFKCVCDLWCNLIKSPSFAAKHISTSMRASCKPILFKRPVRRDKDNNTKDEKEVENDDEVQEIMLSSLNLCNENDDDSLLSTVVEDLNLPLPAPLNLKYSKDITIAGYCDGIICLKLYIGNVILCNPAMKEFKLLPKSFHLLMNDDYEYLEYELECYSEYLGFGYDPKGKDYKVLRFVMYDEGRDRFRAEVYTMDSNSWREIETPKYRERIENEKCICYFPVHGVSDQMIYFNGICYWHAGTYEEFIVSFDMSNELFHEILIPNLPDEHNVKTVTIWRESIALLSSEKEIGVAQSYDMWVMMDDLGDEKSSWRKHLTIGPVEGIKRPLQFWNSEQLLMVTSHGHPVLYDIGTQKSKSFLPYFMLDEFRNQAQVYVNSIVSIKVGNALEDVCISDIYGSKLYLEGR